MVAGQRRSGGEAALGGTMKALVRAPVSGGGERARSAACRGVEARWRSVWCARRSGNGECGGERGSVVGGGRCVTAWREACQWSSAATSRAEQLAVVRVCGEQRSAARRWGGLR